MVVVSAVEKSCLKDSRATVCCAELPAYVGVRPTSPQGRQAKRSGCSSCSSSSSTSSPSHPGGGERGGGCEGGREGGG